MNQCNECEKWRRIAIEAKAANIYYSAQPIYITWDQIPEEAYHCRTKASFRGQAAKELSIQISQEDGYLKRLELAYIEIKVYDEWDATFGAGDAKEHINRAHQAAQAALDKIRVGE